jgi:LacI family transcriptional regulator
MEQHEVNQSQIARKLGISVATVSRALRNQAGISPSTRGKVMELAARLGYEVRSASADDGVSAPLYVGVLLQSPSDTWNQAAYLAGLSQVAVELNVSLVLHHMPPETCARILDPQCQPPAMRDGELAGLIFIFRWPPEVVKELSQRLPCVSIVHGVPKARVDLIDMDHRGGMELLMDRLYELGHRHIGLIGRCAELAWSRARFAGYVESLCRLDLPFHPEYVVDVAVRNLEDKGLPWDSYVDAVAAQVRAGVRAWMATSDWAGNAVCRGLLDRGFRIPEDVSITGFDNSEGTTLDCPPLTTVRVPSQTMGAAALNRMVERLRNPAESPRCTLFSCSLVAGKTSGALLPARPEASKRRK